MQLSVPNMTGGLGHQGACATAACSHCLSKGKLTATFRLALADTRSRELFRRYKATCARLPPQEGSMTQHSAQARASTRPDARNILAARQAKSRPVNRCGLGWQNYRKLTPAPRAMNSTTPLQDRTGNLTPIRESRLADRLGLPPTRLLQRWSRVKTLTRLPCAAHLLGKFPALRTSIAAQLFPGKDCLSRSAVTWTASGRSCARRSASARRGMSSPSPPQTGMHTTP